MKKTVLILSSILCCVLLGGYAVYRLTLHLVDQQSSPFHFAPQKYPPLIGKSYPEDASPTEKQQQWALATSAVLFEFNGLSHDLLGGKTEQANGGRHILSKWWNIDSRQDLLETLNAFEYGGDRKKYDEWITWLNNLSSDTRGKVRRHIDAEGGTASNRMAVVIATRKKLAKTGLAGWDFSRYIALCRWGYHAGYLTEAEAWSKIMPVARLLQSTFSSWNELGENYLIGRQFWSLKTSQKTGARITADCLRLLWEPYSPWARLKWDTSLLPEKQRDDGSAEFRQGRALYFGNGNNVYDKECFRKQAVACFTESAKKGNLDAMFWLGLCSSWGTGVATNQTESFAWFKKAADLGDGPSQYQEGRCYRWSWGVANDKQKTAELMAQSATNGGGPLAETYIGWCYEMHYGVEKNMPEAIRWYRKASDAGEPWAQNNLADCYSEGTYIERNLLKAAQLYKKSAAGGYATGMYRWAECLRNGWGTVKNEQEALVWYRKAADEGEDSAKKFLCTLNRATNTCPAKTP